MKKLISILILFIGFSAFPQDPFLQKSNPEAKKEAIKITNRYIPELALTGEEQLLFQQKVEEFLIRKHKIEAEFSGKEKLDLLYQLQQLETDDMQDILTREQLQVYKKIKPEIQPLGSVEENEKNE
ncbi:hypothetical protein POV26_02305 [Aequorivita todarodis]|uniref:hypothetical protein n=1 Tax=Aequorivita todarodis TaxID=2036821 RepID=UPI0023508EB6|nr:hypothetical protein [Aequorivita todarodis]MDC7999856.1 hypothetical protein [Aequorivita todarodis]